jgi:hypothetical protein
MDKKITFDEKKALSIFQILDKMWREKLGIFQDVVLPQDLWIPENWEQLSQKDKANFFLYASLLQRGGLFGEDSFKWLCVLHKKFPGLFSPETIVRDKITSDHIENCFVEITPEILNGNGVGKLGAGSLSYKIKEHAKCWHDNSVILNQWWGGNLLNVYWGVSEFEEAFRRIDYKRTKVGLTGMRRKIFSLLTIWLQEKNLIPIFPTPIPVDFHAMRILWQTDAINMRGWAKKFEATKDKYPKELTGEASVYIREEIPDQIALWSQKFLWKNQLSHMIINPALWVLSRMLCAEHLQTSSLKDGREFFTVQKLETHPHLWSKNRQNPCEFCPIESFCKWCIPSSPYYKIGWLVRIKRVNHPQSRLTGVNWIASGPPYRVRKDKNRGAVRA